MIERTQLTIYKNCAIIPEKNFKVDDLEAYLSTLTHIDYQNSQVIKHDLTTKYKIQLEQRELELANNNYNYCKFLNQEKTGESQWSSFNYIYYFIVNKKWVSSECIELELEMDVLNTIKNYVSLSEKTIILREHKNRWENASEPNLYLPKIDFYSEGLIPPLFKTAEVDLYQVEHDEYVEGSWYLIYRSHTDQENSPIDILLCGDSEITVDVNATGGFSGMLNRISIKDGGYNPDYVVYGGDNNIGCSITFKYWTSRKEYDYATFTITEPSQCFIWNGKQIFFGNVSENGFVETHHYIYGIIANKSFEEVDFTNLICLRQGVPYSVLRNPENLTTTIISSMHKNSTIENYVGEHGTIETIASVNRTDPKLLKIVKLPYRPL
ncbi:hypothetical protein IKD48_01140 [bacterium]|nr:hypothetical protein [bacterium]